MVRGDGHEEDANGHTHGAALEVKELIKFKSLLRWAAAPVLVTAGEDQNACTRMGSLARTLRETLGRQGDDGSPPRRWQATHRCPCTHCACTPALA